MAAAVAGGVTSLACPPDTDPPLDEPGLVEMLKHRARMLNLAHVFPVGALTVRAEGRGAHRDGRAHRSRLRRVLTSRRGRLPIRRCCAVRCSTPRRSAIALWLRPNEPYLGRNGVAHDGEVATRLGLGGIPSLAETIALATMLALARDTGVRLHVCRLSCAESVAMIREAKARGTARHLRRGGASPAPVRRRHRLVRFECARGAAASLHARSRGTSRGRGRRHDRHRVLGPCAGRRRRQAAALRRGRARRHRPRAPAPAHAEVGGGGGRERCRWRSQRITSAPARLLGAAASLVAGRGWPIFASSMPASGGKSSARRSRARASTRRFSESRYRVACAIRWSRGRSSTSPSRARRGTCPRADPRCFVAARISSSGDHLNDIIESHVNSLARRRAASTGALSS